MSSCACQFTYFWSSCSIRIWRQNFMTEDINGCIYILTVKCLYKQCKLFSIVVDNNHKFASSVRCF